MKFYLTSLLILSTSAALGCDSDVDLGDTPGDTEGGSGSTSDTTDTPGTSTTPGETDGTDSNGSTDPSGTTATPPEGEVEGIDVLFIVDNSASMGPAQSRLQDSASAMVTALDATGLDYRIGVTTTDNGNYWCNGSGIGEAAEGHLIAPSSCRTRPDDFSFSGTETDVFDEACAQRCALEELSLQPGASPWLASDTLAETSMADAIACSLPMGISGCGFEQPLEAMHLATKWSESPDSAESGFMRPNAHLVVIFVTDEVDCSLNPAHESTVVGEQGVGNQVFWSLPEQQVAPTSAVCWNAGVECTGAGTPAYDACVARDKAVDGSNAANDGEAVILPLSRYADRLDTIRASKVPGAGVYTFGITGVPEFYAGPDDLQYSEGGAPSNPDSFEARFGIASSCVQGDIEAVPPVRMLELTETGDQAGVPLFSICSSTYTVFFTEMFAQVGD